MKRIRSNVNWATTIRPGRVSDGGLISPVVFIQAIVIRCLLFAYDSPYKI